MGCPVTNGQVMYILYVLDIYPYSNSDSSNDDSEKVRHKKVPAKRTYKRKNTYKKPKETEGILKKMKYNIINDINNSPHCSKDMPVMESFGQASESDDFHLNISDSVEGNIYMDKKIADDKFLCIAI